MTRKMYQKSVVWDSLDKEYKLTELVCEAFQEEIGILAADDEDEIDDMFKWLDKGLTNELMTHEQATWFINNFNKKH